MSKTTNAVTPSLSFSVNRLTVSRGRSRAEDGQGQIENSAAQKLSCHPQLQGNCNRIKCFVSDRRLYLSGDLPSWYLKQMAQEAVRGVEGVDEIVNDIYVTDSSMN